MHAKNPPQTNSKSDERDAAIQIMGGESKIPEWKLEEGDAEILRRLLACEAVTQAEEEQAREIVKARLLVIQRLMFAGSSDAHRLAVKTAQAETGRVVKALERLHFRRN